MTVYYLDHDGGNNANNGLSFANRKKTYDSLGTLVTNDEIRVIASPDPVSIGSGQWTNGSAAITFASALPVMPIEDGEFVWRGVTNVTATRVTVAAVEGTYGVSLAFAAAFTTGKAGYRRIGTVGSGAIGSPRAVNLLGVAALTQIVSASADSAIQTIALPFAVLYDGSWYDSVTVGSNSWLTFAATGTASSANPATPSIRIGAADNSWQRLYHGAENSGNTYRIRFEGTNATSGTPGTPNIVWEMTFDKTDPGKILVDIGANTYKVPSATDTTNGATTVYTMGTTVSTGYDITQSVTALDLSAFDTVSFAMGGTAPFKGGSIALCSDFTGDTVVETIPFESNLAGTDPTTATVQAAGFAPIVYRKGSALGSNINSIAVYYSTDPGASTNTLYLDNIIATTAASGIDHAALIGKKTTDEFYYYHLKSIKPGAITIGQVLATAADVVSGASRPYYGVTEAVTTYVQPTTYIPFLSALRTLAGTALLTSITGGWNRTDMSTRTGKSYLRAWGSTTGTIVAGARFIGNVSGFAFVAMGSSTAISGATVSTCDDIDLISHASNDVFNMAETFILHQSWKIKSYVQSTQWLLNPTVGMIPDIEIDTIINCYSSSGAFRCNPSIPSTKFSRRARPIKIRQILNSNAYGLQAPGSYDMRYRGITFGGNRTADVQVTADGGLELLECSTPTVSHTAAAATAMVSMKDAFWVYGGSGKIQGTVVHASATALQLAPTVAAVTALKPLMFQLADIAVSAGVAITIRAWARKDNVGLTMGMMIPGGVITGIETDQAANVSAANTWEELSITVTPTVDGILEVWASCYGGTTFNGYITELSWST